jgi:hypothetical protein
MILEDSTEVRKGNTYEQVESGRGYGSKETDGYPLTATCKESYGIKGLVVHLEGHTTPPAPFIQVNGVPMVAQNIPVTDEQIEAKEKKMLDYKQKEFLAQHLILSISLW